MSSSPRLSSSRLPLRCSNDGATDGGDVSPGTVASGAGNVLEAATSRANNESSVTIVGGDGPVEVIVAGGRSIGSNGVGVVSSSPKQQLGGSGIPRLVSSQGSAGRRNQGITATTLLPFEAIARIVTFVVIHDQMEKYLLRHANPLLFPYFSMMRKAGIKIDPLLDPGVMYSGEVVMDHMPSPDEFEKWVQRHRNQLNKKNNKVKIGHSEGRGKGLYAAKIIKKKSLIGEYGGVERDKRRKHSTKFAFALDNDGKFEINAEHCGGLTRYINAPNEGEEANVVASIVGAKIKITAKKDIGVGDELLLDYGPEYFVDPPVGEEEEELLLYHNLGYT